MEREIEEKITEGETPSSAVSDESTPLLPTDPPVTKSVRTKVPEIEIHLYRQGKGPIEVFKSALGGWEQDQLEVQEILDKYGFKSLYAFSRDNGRSAPIRFNPRNGRSLLPYTDGSVIYIDGEIKDSLIKPITKVFLSVSFLTIMLAVLMKEYPNWMQKLNVSGSNFPPWALACIVIVFTRMRKRTKVFLKNRGW
ncbi:uncharacterized protein LOC124931517 [Impatiens glandulifera]|uniref:uncharacterized protein LOC124931517 n=1 Tax=Impatiens glandulifera TaxID=253017 RepID=UPI001FB12F36|nr:uncharacterized protein LOC124931517 [Impatiens glandulifera]